MCLHVHMYLHVSLCVSYTEKERGGREREEKY